MPTQYDPDYQFFMSRITRKMPVFDTRVSDMSGKFAPGAFKKEPFTAMAPDDISCGCVPVYHLQVVISEPPKDGWC